MEIPIRLAAPFWYTPSEVIVRTVEKALASPALGLCVLGFEKVRLHRGRVGGFRKRCQEHKVFPPPRTEPRRASSSGCIRAALGAKIEAVPPRPLRSWPWPWTG